MKDGARFQTLCHIHKVREFLSNIRWKILDRESEHDSSKLLPPEVEIFDEYTNKLKDLTYGSDEYQKCLKEMEPALKHHYANNRHHPEFHENGIDDMNLIDIIEMLSDWKAATLRHKDGSIEKSIEYNTKRFNISPQLAQILKNTIIYMDWKSEND